MATLAIGSLPLLSLGLAGAAVVLLLQAAEDPAVTRGRELFDRSFHRADGLGTPEMNGDSCRACPSRVFG